MVAMVIAGACAASADPSTPVLPPPQASDPPDAAPAVVTTPTPSPEAPVVELPPAAVSAAPADALPAVVVLPDPLNAEVLAIASGFAGQVGIAVIDLETAAVYEFQADRRVPLASVAKIPLMLAVLRDAPSAVEQVLVTRMITLSDNLAADELWVAIGGRESVGRVWAAVGLWPDGVALGDHWGAVEANAREVVQLIATAIAGMVFPREVQRAVRQELEHVVAEQAWGISAGVPESAVVGLKNGWLEYGDGWLIHSVGYVRDRDGVPRYAIAILTSDQPSLRDAVDTIESISAAVHAALGLPPVLATPTGG